jgi:hypothetical protein
MADKAMSERDKRETLLFMEEVRAGTGPLNAALAVGWSPAQLRRKLKDPEFAELVAEARERRIESIEATLYQMAERGHFKAIQMVLYNERADRWKDVRHINVATRSELDVGVVVSVKQAALELLRERGVAGLQPAPAAIEASVVDVDA